MASVTYHHEVMGTVVSFLVEPGRLERPAVLAALAGAAEELDRLDRIFSTYRSDSPVSRLRRGEAALAELPSEVGEVLSLCDRLRRDTEGWFDPWAMPGGVDPTGLVKGWAIDRAAAILAAAGARAGLVNGGGDVASFGTPAEGRFLVGIQHPWRRDALACVVGLEPGGALATSGRYERGEHLVDPFGGAGRSRLGRDAVASASVAGPLLAVADALATALAVSGPAGLDLVGRADGYEAYLVTSTGAELTTPGFAPAEDPAGLAAAGR